MSSAIDSMLDCLISVLNFFALKKSIAPASARFNFGFGKIGALVALGEGAFIAAVGVGIAFMSVQKLISPSPSIQIGSASGVMVMSVVVTAALVWYLQKEAKRTNSLIIRADALHYKTDLITNGAVLAGLVAVLASGAVWVDAALGLLISGYIGFSAVSLIKEGVLELLDRALNEEQTSRVIEIIRAAPEVKDFHHLRSRVVGGRCFLSVHLVFDENELLRVAHDVGGKLEKQIREVATQMTWVFDMHFDVRDDSDEEQI